MMDVELVIVDYLGQRHLHQDILACRFWTVTVLDVQHCTHFQFVDVRSVLGHMYIFSHVIS